MAPTQDARTRIPLNSRAAKPRRGRPGGSFRALVVLIPPPSKARLASLCQKSLANTQHFACKRLGPRPETPEPRGERCVDLESGRWIEERIYNDANNKSETEDLRIW